MIYRVVMANHGEFNDPVGEGLFRAISPEEALDMAFEDGEYEYWLIYDDPGDELHYRVFELVDSEESGPCKLELVFNGIMERV
jgi:hypothetical protein